MSEIIVKEQVGQSGYLRADANAEIRRKYAVFGVTEENAAITAVTDYLLATMGSPPRIGSLELDDVSVSEVVLDYYEVQATWRTFQRRSQPATFENQFNFELRLDPVKIKIPIGGIQVFKADGEPDWQPVLVNDLGNGEEPEGVDIYEPTYDESETHWIPLASLTDQYKAVLKSSVGKVNASGFRGNLRGEVLLLGVSGSRRGANDAEVTFRWSVRENQTNFALGGVPGITKEGWQYLWPKSRIRRFEDQPMYQFASHVAVATVFRYAELNNIFDYPIPT